MDTIEKFNIDDLPVSSVNLFLGKRRSGKSVLCEYLIYEMIQNKLVDCVFLFSKTQTGFNIIKDKECRLENIEKLDNILHWYKMWNEYNTIVNERRKISIKTVVIIDDFAIDLKNKDFNILEEIATNGRHFARAPLSLSFCILCQSLTKIPRVVRLNCDNIFLNAIASEKERALILDENMYIVDGSRQGKNEGRDLYQNLVTSTDYQFVCIENWRQNIKAYKDYVKTYKADVSKLKL
jgi:hypothetical protein